TGNAIDIAGFILKNGERISIKRDWKNAGQKSNFLKAIRDGACDVYATVLSPEYNAAHADHFHFDQAQRGKTGWGVCR
ncbi:extensin family protein, partial [Neptunomonas phycophila]